MTSSSIKKFDVMKFDGYGNFELWQRRVKDLLAQQRMVKALSRKKSEGTSDADWKELEYEQLVQFGFVW